MQIKRLTDDECRAVLQRASLARLGCARDNQPYVVPLDVAYDEGCLYAFSTLGQKVEWMRENPKVCVQVDEIAHRDEWRSVVATGSFEELPAPKFASEREHARDLLKRQQHWWLNALGERRIEVSDQRIQPIFFRIKVEEMSGLAASPE